MYSRTVTGLASRNEFLRWAFIASLVGGVLILAGGALMALIILMGVMMGGAMGMMLGQGMFLMMAVGMGLWGLLTGGLVIAGALALRKRPANPTPWGITILAAGSLSLLTMGGFLIGAVAAIVGGVLALVAGTSYDRSGPGEPTR